MQFFRINREEFTFLNTKRAFGQNLECFGVFNPLESSGIVGNLVEIFGRVIT